MHQLLETPAGMKAQRGDGDGNAAAVGVGAPGAPAGGVLTVQGVEGGAPLQVVIVRDAAELAREAERDAAIANLTAVVGHLAALVQLRVPTLPLDAPATPVVPEPKADPPKAPPRKK